MRQVVINKCHGGFALSPEIIRACAKYGNEIALAAIAENPESPEIYDDSISREDPALIQAVREVPKELHGQHTTLKIVEIPNDLCNNTYTIEDYDGYEWIAEYHRTWG